MTDDALALAVNDCGVLAHPGPAFIAIAAADRALREGSLSWMGPQVGESDKAHFAPSVGERTLPLTAVYYLEPRARFALTSVRAGVVERLLGNAAVPYVLTPERLLHHLEVARAIMSSVPQFSLTLTDSELSEDILRLLEEHMRQIGA